VVDVAGPLLTETVRKLFAVTITRQVNARSALGTNLTDISDWSREWCFVDAFKITARSISSSTNLTATSGWADSITVFSQPGEIAEADFSFISTIADSMTNLVCGMHLSIWSRGNRTRPSSMRSRHSSPKIRSGGSGTRDMSMKFEVWSFNAKRVWETILIVHLLLIDAIAYLRRIKHV
jgi:hypothetical protein